MAESHFSINNDDSNEDMESSGVLYFNHAGQALLTDYVKKAGIDALRRPPWLMHTDDDEKRVRELFASLIEADDSSEISIMPSTAFAITLAARNIQRSFSNQKDRLKSRILLLQDQMNSAVYPWQQICNESNGDLKLDIVPHPSIKEGGWTEAILSRLDDHVLVACLPPLHWSDGSLIDLEAISPICQKHNIALIVDATQAVGIMTCRVKKIKPTLLACSIHKWLRGPPGMSLVYVAPDIHDTWIPLDMHGRGRDLADGQAWDASKDEMGPSGYPETYFCDSRKFDSGGKKNPILVPMLRASLEQVSQLNVEDAQAHLKKLGSPLLSWARSRNYSISCGPHAGHIIGIQPPQRTPEEMLEMSRLLLKKGIVIAVRCGFLRISLYTTNTASEVQSLIDGLASFENEA